MPRKSAKQTRGVYEKEPGSGIWWVRYSDGKRIRREKVGRKSDAAKLYQVRKAQIIGGEKIPKRKGHGLKVSDLCEAVLQWYQDRERKSIRSFKQRIGVIDDELGHRVAETLTPEEIDAWLSKHEGWSGATKNRYKAVLSRAYQLGVQRGKVPSNPARLVDRFPEAAGRVRYLLQEEETRLRAAITKLSPKQLPAFEVALHTGMRQSEQFRLTWEKVDFKRRTVFIGKTKNGEPRELPMSRTCHDALHTLHQGQHARGGVFPSSRYKTAIKDPKKWWQAALKGAEVTDFHWHDLRHTFVSRLVMAGVDLRTVQELSGHKELNMLTRYAHLAPAHNRKAIELLDPTPTA
jgi:integrase